MKITVQVATSPDREFPVAEMWLGHDMVAEINQENDGKLALEFYEPGLGKSIEVEEFCRALQTAKEALAAPSAFEDFA